MSLESDSDDTEVPHSITVYGSKSIPLDSAGKMHQTDLGKYLQYVAKHWASTNPSLQRIYIRFAYDEDLGIMNVLSGYIGHSYRLMKLFEGVWRYVSYEDWNPNPKANGARHFRSFDDLPGILNNDLDFFDDDYPSDHPWIDF